MFRAREGVFETVTNSPIKELNYTIKRTRQPAFQAGQKREREKKKETVGEIEAFRVDPTRFNPSTEFPEGLRIQINPGSNGVSGLFDPGVVQRRQASCFPKGKKPLSGAFGEREKEARKPGIGQ